MKRGAPDHWKMKKLARLAGVPPQYSLPWANGVMERIWHFTAKYAIQGDIGRVPDTEIAEVCCWPPHRAERLITALVGSGFLVRSEKYRLLVHDWPDHCDGSVQKTLKNRHLPFIFPENSGKVEEGIATKAEPVTPSLSLAFPEPLPKPKPEPNGSRNLAPDSSIPVNGNHKFEDDRQAAWEWTLGIYPGDVKEEWDGRIFVDVINTFEDIVLLRKNLELWIATKRWRDGFTSTLENFLRKKQFRYPPKQDAGSENKRGDEWISEH